MKLLNIAIRNSSKHGQIILDTFAGGGTIAISAEQTGRKAYMMELDPKWCDIIVKRYCKYMIEQGEKLEVTRNGTPMETVTDFMNA